MRTLDVSLADPAENLALDEALLWEAERTDDGRETLRIWEFAKPTVIVGRGSRVADEVHVDACAARQTTILRRTTGGAAVVAGPGCLLYSLVLDRRRRAQLLSIGDIHTYVLNRLIAGLATVQVTTQLAGTSDLCVVDDARQGSSPHQKKVSGNSLRVRPHHVLYHGTLLYDFSVSQLGDVLRIPPRMPDYRSGRPHDQFVRNLPANRNTLQAALTTSWQADETAADWPRARTEQLAREKYDKESWNLRL